MDRRPGHRIQFRPDNLVIGFERVGFANQFELIDFTFCTPYFEARTIEWLHKLNYNHEQGLSKETENSQGSRNSFAYTGRVRGELRQGGEAGEEITDQPLSPWFGFILQFNCQQAIRI